MRRKNSQSEMFANHNSEAEQERVMKEDPVEHAVRMVESEKPPVFIRPAKRARWTVNSKHKQRVLILEDVSTSMKGQKGIQAHEGTQKLIEPLADQENHDGFRVSVIHFNDDAKVIHPWMSAAALSGCLAPLAPGGSTNIEAAFETALQMLEEAQKQDQSQTEFIWLRHVLFIYSDGQITQGGDPRSVANEVKKLADVVTIAVGDDADEALLLDLATSPEHAYKVSDTVSLRAFLADAGPTLVQTYQQGQDATYAMTQLQVQSA